MARPSKIDRLPQELRDLIADLRTRGRTIDELLAKLRELDVDIGRSSLGTWVQRFDAVRERLRSSKAAADAIMGELGRDGGDDRIARFNVQMLHAGIMELAAAEDEDGAPVTLDPKTAKMLSSAIRDLAQAKKIDQDSTLALKKELARAAADEIAKAQKEAAADGRPADPAEVLRRIREDVYGIYE